MVILTTVHGTVQSTPYELVFGQPLRQNIASYRHDTRPFLVCEGARLVPHCEVERAQESHKVDGHHSYLLQL